MPNQPSPCLSRQVKATDGGSPPLSSHVRLHISWVARPGPSSEPLAFDEPHFNFAVMETDPVNHMVGVISIEMGPSQVWFNITGEAQRLHCTRVSGALTPAPSASRESFLTDTERF